MLDPQVVVNLLPEVGVSVDLVRHGHSGATNEFHKPPFIRGWLLQIRAERGTIFTGRFQQRPASGDSRLQLNLEIAQAVSQRRLSLSTGFSGQPKVRRGVG